LLVGVAGIEAEECLRTILQMIGGPRLPRINRQVLYRSTFIAVSSGN